jgi:hypothetical protein
LPPSSSVAQKQEASKEEEKPSQEEEKSKTAEDPTEGERPEKVGNKFFIVKSLTVEDLELSVRNGIWATQAHNEATLNKAFEVGNTNSSHYNRKRLTCPQTAENVYLIFSANKSGEYFGYARMTSTIDDESSASIEWAPRAEATTDDPDLPRAIPTNPTEFAPKGRIIDDSARGTIFWEADQEEDDDPSKSPKPEDDDNDDDDAKSQKEGAGATGDEGEDPSPPTAAAAQAFGKPFRIEWISTTRLPFYRTRGLRNPWNANREVKIARDGTELETSVGKRLLQMFHRSLSAPAGAPPMPPTGPAAAGGGIVAQHGMHMGLPGPGYPPMRPY